mgnify:FL=1
MGNSSDATNREIADAWEGWCGETKWSRAVRELDRLGWRVQWWAGYPRSASAIPLTFTIYDPNGDKFPSSARLRDLTAAVKAAEPTTDG